MVSINLNNTHGYYDLNGSGTGKSSAVSGKYTPTKALLDSLSAGSTNNADNTDTITLSTAARNHLNTNSYSTTGGYERFSLSGKQKQAITDILSKYKKSPYTQDTFNKIQNDLASSGLGVSTLQTLDRAQNFTTTRILINYLSGVSNTSGAPSDRTETTKANNYIADVKKQWQSFSTTYKK